VNFAIPAGKIVAIVGPSGSGKTTIINLLARFYDVGSGAVRVDGHDVRAITMESLRRQIGKRDHPEKSDWSSQIVLDRTDP